MIKKIIITLLFLLCSCAPQTQNIRVSSLVWENNVDVAIRKADESHKLVLLYFYGENCEWCVLQNASINDKSVQKLLNDKFVLVSLDVETSQLAKLAEIDTVPTVVVIVPNKKGGEPVGAMIGYLGKEKFKEFIYKSIAKANNLQINSIAKK